MNGKSYAARGRRAASRLRELGRWALAPMFVAACTQPNVKAPGATARGELAAVAMLGSGPKDLGANRPDEATPQGPRSLAVSSDESRVYVLDQENGRIQVFEDSQVVQQIPLPSAAVVDIAVLANGNLVLLETSGQGQLRVIDGSGKQLSQTLLQGIGVPHPELVAGMVVRADGVWLTYRGRNTRILDAEGRADPARPMLAGQPTRDGQYVVSLSAEGTSLAILKRERAGVPKNRISTLHFEQPVIHTLLFDTDDAGRVYLITLHIWGKGKEQQATTLLTVLSPELEEQKHLTLPTPASAYDVARYASITGSGAVYYLDLSQTDAKVRRFL
jgi:hypothetical protein